MGALLAFAGAGSPPADAGARARRWIEAEERLPVAGERADAVKYDRRHGPGAPLAASARGWLACAGSFVHPRVDADDTGALLALLEAEGADVLDALEGHYALVWRDGDAVTVAPDAMGRLHVFVAETPGGTLVSTSAVALAAATDAAPDPEAGYEFLAGGTLYEDRTPFSRVRRLAGGRLHRFVAGRPAQSTPHRLLPAGDGPDGPPGELALRLLETWAPLVERALAPRATLLPDLTGGVDSRLVLGLVRRARTLDDVTVTGGDVDPDVLVARRFAAALGLRLRLIPRTRVDAAQSSFAKAMDAAALAEAGCDAAQYAWIADLHGGHAALFSASVNGSGGELLRNYWWGKRTWSRTDLDAVGAAARRFAGLALAPDILGADHRRYAGTHFRAVIARSLAARAGQPFHALLDHAYVDLRMQCWQGGIASASNQLWPVVSPLLWTAPLRIVLAADPRRRLGGRLTAALFARFEPVYRRMRLDTGFPPARPSLANFWRFAPGLAALPGRLWPRVRQRLFPRPPPVAPGAAVVRALCASGAGDYLDLEKMALRPLLDDAAYAAFLKRGCETGEVPLPMLGRLLSLERAYRAASRK
jgi:asparagine synthase (glutamine-hydrolysing)